MNRLLPLLIACTLLPLAAAPQQNVAPAPGGPGIVRLDSLEGPYEPVVFRHGRHAARFAQGCGDCHHQHSGYDRNPCKRCHAIDAAQFKESAVRSFRACSTCHGDYDPAAPDVPGLKVAYHQMCFSCHEGTGEEDAAPKSCEQQCHTRK